MDASRNRKAALEGSADISKLVEELASTEPSEAVKGKRIAALEEVGTIANEFAEQRAQDTVSKSKKRRDQINVHLNPRELNFLRNAMYMERDQDGQFRTIRSLVEEGLHSMERLRAVNLEELGLRPSPKVYETLLDAALNLYVETHLKRKRSK